MKQQLPKRKPKPLNKFIVFTGLGFQIGVTIYLGSLLGDWLDDKYSNTQELYKKVCTLLAVFIAMYSAIKQVINISKKND